MTNPTVENSSYWIYQLGIRFKSIARANLKPAVLWLASSWGLPWWAVPMITTEVENFPGFRKASLTTADGSNEGSGRALGAELYTEDVTEGLESASWSV